MYNLGSPHRPVALTMRDDLKVVEQAFRGEPFFVVGDMLAMEFYRLNDQEYALLGWLDGKRSIDEIKESFEAKFSPYQITYREIQNCIVDFHKKGIVASVVQDRGRHLYRMGREKRVKKKLSELKNVFAIRWRGINPDRIFRFTTPIAGWFFSKWMVPLNLTLMFAALLLLLMNFGQFQSRLPSLESFFSSSNWLPLASVMMGLKIIHEFGHGIVFTRYGGRCHELGVMLLVFTPTLYVNTSDSWRLTSKWKRAAIAAAGVYVELILAALATFGWWFSHPGNFHYLCLNVMFLGSVSAFLLNGNPLLKFDGYYLLSDLIEIPNLQQRSAKLIRNWFLYYGLGVHEEDEMFSTRATKTWLAVYAIAAFVYRFVIVYGIAFVMVQLFRPVGLEEIAKMFGLFTMVLLVCLPFVALVKYFWTPGRTHRIEKKRAIITAGILGTLLLAAFVIPLPDHVACGFTIEPRNSTTVYVPHDAVLQEIHIQPHQTVRQGDKIATLRNLDVELEILKLQGRITELKEEEKMLRRVRHHSSQDSGRPRTLRQERNTIESQLRELQQVQDGMVLIAPRSGTVLPIWGPTMPKSESDQLGTRDGWTLDAQNAHSSFQKGQPICKIGDLGQVEAELLIDQRDVKFVRRDQTVKLLLDSRSHGSILSKITSISESEADEVSARADRRFGGDIQTKERATPRSEDLVLLDSSKPTNTTFEARAPIDNVDYALLAGLRGTAQIQVGHRTIAAKIHRMLLKTFRLEM